MTHPARTHDEPEVAYREPTTALDDAIVAGLAAVSGLVLGALLIGLHEIAAPLLATLGL